MSFQIDDFFAIFTKILIQNMLEHLGHYINTTFQKHKKVTFLQFLSMSSALRNPLEKAWQPLSHQLEWKMMLTTLSLLKNTVFENNLKCRTWDSSNFAIFANFCPFKVDLSGNTVWPQTLQTEKLICWRLSIENQFTSRVCLCLICIFPFQVCFWAPL